MKKISANKGNNKEIKEALKEYSGTKVDTKIPEGNQYGFVVACFTKGTPDANGVQKNRVQIISKTINVWEAMTSHDGKAFNCHKVIVLHDPNVLIAAEQKAKDEAADKK